MSNYELAVPTNDYDLQKGKIKMTAYCQMHADLTERIRTILKDNGFVRIEQKGIETYFDFDTEIDVDNTNYYGDEVFYDDFKECRIFAIEEEKRLIRKKIKKLQSEYDLPKIYCVIDEQEDEWL